MADLSNYTPIYIRTTGNDTTGDGSSGSPYATAQKAYDIANVLVATTSGNYVLDFGVGSFGGVTLAQDWPSRIAVRGAGDTQSFLGGITGNGADVVIDFETWDVVSPVTNGFNISLVSDLSVNVGVVSASGGDGSGTYAADGGAVTLTDSISGNITSSGSSSGGLGGPGGAVTLTNSTSGNITNTTDGLEQGGVVTLTNSTSGTITSSAAVTLTNSTSGTITSSAAVTLTNSTSGTITSNGGAVTLADSTSGNVSTPGSGEVTLSGSTSIPNFIVAGSVDTTNLRKGRGVNGSNILGLI
jgi:hypothetical protein